MCKLIIGIVILNLKCLIREAYTFPDDVVVNIVLNDSEPYQLSVESNMTYHIQRIDVSPTTGFIVFQAHTQWDNMTLSLDLTPTRGRYTSGSDIGVVAFNDGKSSVAVYLVMISHSIKTTVLLMATDYDHNTPVPGACNMELPLVNDPNIYMDSKPPRSVVQFAYGNAHIADRCGDKSTQGHLQYDIYQYYFNERDLSLHEYFSVVTKLMKFKNVSGDSHPLVKLSSSSRTEMCFASYLGQGIGYAVVLRRTDNKTSTASSVYVPAVSYGCSYPSDNCVSSYDILVKVVVVLLALFGVMLIFFGHRLFEIAMFFIGVLAAFTFTYIFTARYATALSSESVMVISSLSGITGGFLWLFLWLFVASPFISVSLVGLELGFIFASILMNVTPLGLYVWARTDLTYGLMFATIMFSCNVFLAFSKQLNIIGNAVIGCYLVVLTFDLFLQGSIRYLLLVSVWKASVPGFIECFVTLPIQVTDIILFIIWLTLAVTGTVFQLQREKNRPPFPASRWKYFWFRRTHQTLLTNSTTDGPDEEEPLLRSRVRVYT